MRTLAFVAILITYLSGAKSEDYPTNVTIQIQCHELSVMATWDKAQFNVGNASVTVSVTKIEWNDPLCQGFEESDTQFWATTNFSVCRSRISQSSETIVQENTAHVYLSYRSGVIQRDIVYNFILRCAIQRSVLTPLGASYTVTENRFFGNVNKTAKADFDVRMDIYSDATFTQILPNPTATSFQPIFIGIREANDNELLRFVTQQCFATPARDRQGVSYTFFLDKCPVDESFQRIDSSSKHAFNFKIGAFKFIQLSKSVYIHCRLAVCKTNETSYKCTQEKNCNRRRRRDVSLAADTADDGDMSSVEEITVMTQQITFLETSCKETTCPRFSRCVDLGPPVCRCGHGYVLNSITKTCGMERTFTVYGLHFDEKFVNSYLDPYSKSFIELAIRIEKQLDHYVSRLNDDDIVGIKVIRAREGSVIVDLQIMYKETSGETKAYATFLKSISKSHVETFVYEDALIIKPNIPTMQREENTSMPFKLVLTVLVPLVVVVMIIAFVVKERGRLPCWKSNEEKIEA